ncbi:hypothetical protein BKA24_002543 [Microbacterium marinum]|uniref:Uncharacterized protein n=1 Tax=Microbacterium marinum TaxID=421115 RepID=A0A7W7BUG7_9MICO|nr:hypothetical protein [Microbacterium marinum]MBB4667834.1 hypothetical protein [Microbacterium marinum]
MALFATFVALLSHVAGGGEVPGWLGVFVPLVLASAVSTVVVSHRLSMWRLSVAVIASQLLFHTLFTLGGPSGAFLLHGHLHGHHDGEVAASVATVTATTTHDHDGGVMWAAHAVAAVITVAGIYVGERSVLLAAAAVRAARTWLDRKTISFTATLSATFDSPRQVVRGVVRALRSLCVLPGDRHRGPPLSFGI